MVQKNENKILLHACCGICSGYPISLLKEMGYTPVVYFCNPNLDTEEEYNKRLQAQKIVCMYHWVDLIAEEYKHNEFLEIAKGLEDEPEKGKRCEKCIELRLRQTANKAKELGIKKFTTSLVISPHKNFEKITNIGKSVSSNMEDVQTNTNETNIFETDTFTPLPPEDLSPEDLPLEYLPLDFKKKDGFLKTNKLSKELGIYRQNYCGCEYSKR